MVCWDLKVGTSTIRTFNAFSIKGFFKISMFVFCREFLTSYTGKMHFHVMQHAIFVTHFCRWCKGIIIYDSMFSLKINTTWLMYPLCNISIMNE